ncbi:MAG: flavin reductase family protein [Pseudomonadota bacterium]|nr:flavin reductase family protein [Pseudomonadota bacterium]
MIDRRTLPHLQPATTCRYRAAMGSFATGVAVVTSEWGGKFHGMTISSLASVSLDPCLLLVCLKKSSRTGEAIRARKAMAVNLLRHGQESLARRFVGQFTDRFDGLEIAIDDAGMPLLPGCIAHLSCRLLEVYPGGDHDIFIAHVTSCAAVEGAPLVYHRGGFGGYAPAAPQPTPA